MLINDLTPHPRPTNPPALPPAGGTYVDPTFNTPVLRITDDTDSGGGKMFSNGYSAIYDTFNTLGNWISFVSLDGGNWLANIDVNKRALLSKRSIPKGATYWSRKDPNIFYSMELWNAARIWSYDVNKDAYTIVADLAPLIPKAFQLQDTAWIDSRGMSWDDNRFHVSTHAVAGAGPINYIYDVKLGKMIGSMSLDQALKTGWTPNPPDAAYLFSKSTMDSAGRVLYTADTQLIYDVLTGKSFLTEYGTKAPLGYGDVHPDTGLANRIVGAGGLGITGPGDGFYPFLAAIDPNNLESYREPRTQLGPRFLWGFDSHASFRDKNGFWATFDLDGGPIGADIGKVPIFGEEIFQFAVTGSTPDGKDNNRIAHHYSDPTIYTPTNFPGTPQPTLDAWRYWSQTHASPSQNNIAVCFNSNMLGKTIHVYVAWLDSRPSTTPPVPPVPNDGTLAGVSFSNAEAQILHDEALWLLSQKRG